MAEPSVWEHEVTFRDDEWEDVAVEVWSLKSDGGYVGSVKARADGTSDRADGARLLAATYYGHGDMRWFHDLATAQKWVSLI